MGSIDAYYKSKTEVYRNMKPGDIFLKNVDDAKVLEYTEKYPVPCDVQTFSLDRTDTDTFVKAGFVYVCEDPSLERHPCCWKT